MRIHITESGSSPAEYLYGTTLRVPGELIVPEGGPTEPQQVVSEFREHMNQVRPVPVERHGKGKVFVHKDLGECTHVFLRAPPNKKALQCPYTGPHKIINRESDRVYEIDFNGKNKHVSVENVKPAHFIPYQEWTALRKNRDDERLDERTIVKPSNNISPIIGSKPIYNIERYASNVGNNPRANRKHTNDSSESSRRNEAKPGNVETGNDPCTSNRDFSSENTTEGNKTVKTCNEKIEKRVSFVSTNTAKTKNRQSTNPGISTAGTRERSVSANTEKKPNKVAQHATKPQKYVPTILRRGATLGSSNSNTRKSAAK